MAYVAEALKNDQTGVLEKIEAQVENLRASGSEIEITN